MSRAQLTAQEEQERAYKQTEKRNIKAKMPKCNGIGKGKGKVVIAIKPSSGMTR